MSCLRTFLPLASLTWMTALPSHAQSLEDITDVSGIDFVHSNGARGEKQYQEVMGSGVCVFHADSDSLLDVYWVNSAGENRLFRNLGNLRFEDVTARSGTGDPSGYGMGAIATDIDADGDEDLFVTNLGPNRLFVNRGDGTFEEQATEWGVADAHWGAGAAFFDADGDRRPDLYVANYVVVASPDTNECRGSRGRLRLYCHPKLYPPAQDLFYRNTGTAFENLTVSHGVEDSWGRGLGVVASDLDNDGWTDVFVANDLDPNFFFRNLGNGTFEEIGAIAGVAYNDDGLEESGMGVAAADYDRDGYLDLFVTNFQNESNTVYRNEGDGFFLDVSAACRLGVDSLQPLGWGTGFFDYDLDGWLDVFVVNGHTESDIAEVDQLATWKQADLLHRNLGDGTFVLVTDSAAPEFLVPRAGRGGALADLDDDGDLDLLVSNQNGAANVYASRSEAQGNAWIGLEVVWADGSGTAIGARVTVESAVGRQTGEVQVGGSYLSCHDARLLFGLGESTEMVLVTVRVREQVYSERLEAGRYHQIELP